MYGSLWRWERDSVREKYINLARPFKIAIVRKSDAYPDTRYVYITGDPVDTDRILTNCATCVVRQMVYSSEGIECTGLELTATRDLIAAKARIMGVAGMRKFSEYAKCMSIYGKGEGS